MANPIYQATVMALEAILSPRVVSRLLQEGLLQVGKTPDTVSYPDLELILKAQVYRQLQVAMPVVKSKEVIQRLLSQLAVAHQTVAPSALKAQGEMLAELKKALLPFNLYFEWPETQKLRAQLQLLEAEQQAGRAAETLLKSGQDQLALLRQKLEDHLVTQARELSELQAALEVIRSLGGPKARRLESLVQQIASEQQRRQLAPAEVERARKLATDLRKLMESSVVNEEGLPPVPVGELLDPEDDEAPLIDMAALDPEVSARLLLIDVERESRELNVLADEYANLLGFDPALRERIAELHQQLMRRQPLGEELSQLRSDLQMAHEAWRERLSREFRDLAQQLERLSDSSDAALAVQVSLSILETTLPAPADIEQARELAALAREAAARQGGVGSALQLKLSQQAQAIEQLQRIAKRYQGETIGVAEGVRLKQALATLEGVHSQGHLSPAQVADARQLAVELEELVARQATALDGQRAEVRSLLHQVEALPSLPSLAAGGERLAAALKQQLLQLEMAPLAPVELAASKAWVDRFKNDLQEAYQRELSHMMAQARDLGDTEALSYIQTALVHSESGLFPSLTAAQEALTSAVERYRAKQLRELHQLEAESRHYAHTPEFAELSGLLQAARADLTAGKMALKQGWLRLEALRQQSAQQAKSFLPRLAAALSAFEPLARLNSDDSQTTGRILSHLDSQRGAFDRVSPAMQHELLASLCQAEELLEVLRDEYEATRAVADQLVSSNAIDDLLGLFDAPKPMRHPALDDWLDSYLNEPGVRCAAVFSASELLAGRLVSDSAAVQVALKELAGRVTQLGDRLALGAPRLLTLELSKQSVVVHSALTYLLLIVLDIPTGLSVILYKLRRELPALTAILHGLNLP